MPSPEATSFYCSLRIQARVIWALLLREIITRYGRDNLGFLWMFVAPMLFIIVIISVRTSGGDEMHGLSIIAFFITGYCGAIMLRSIASRCINAVEPNRALMFHRNVKVIDIYAARMLLEIAGQTMAFLFLLTGCWFLGLIPLPADALQLLAGWFTLIWFGCALAIALGPLSEMYDCVEKIWNPLSIILFILSGAFFMVDWLPEATRNALLLLPWIHGMEILREGYFGSSAHAHYDMGYLFVWNLLLTLFGLALMRSAIYKTS